ncbi:tryptophan synthase subunit alpha [Halomonas chromatireducens]|uniref:Tryptophan synthase subunit alpha n=1 Tax=Halomonas chromatireducens TaxID=507626 RepID=A0A0X8HD04_9GAMM|nr:tryptophan synthase subunit alpha [Halomonas chromatireducens]
MNRIDQRFAALKADGRRALIPFITAGDPAPEYTVGFMHALVEVLASGEDGAALERQRRAVDEMGLELQQQAAHKSEIARRPDSWPASSAHRP